MAGVRVWAVGPALARRGLLILLACDWVNVWRRHGRWALDCRSREFGRVETARERCPCASVGCDDAGNAAPTQASGELRSHAAPVSMHLERGKETRGGAKSAAPAQILGEVGEHCIGADASAAVQVLGRGALGAEMGTGSSVHVRADVEGWSGAGRDRVACPHLLRAASLIALAARPRRKRRGNRARAEARVRCGGCCDARGSGCEGGGGGRGGNVTAR